MSESRAWSLLSSTFRIMQAGQEKKSVVAAATRSLKSFLHIDFLRGQGIWRVLFHMKGFWLSPFGEYTGKYKLYSTTENHAVILPWGLLFPPNWRKLYSASRFLKNAFLSWNKKQHLRSSLFGNCQASISKNYFYILRFITKIYSFKCNYVVLIDHWTVQCINLTIYIRS